jgi:hypothetical protein
LTGIHLCNIYLFLPRNIEARHALGQVRHS